MSKLKMAVIGAGHLGRFHAKLLAGMPDVELVAVADPVEAARNAVAAECNTRSVDDYHELADHIDAAVVATPTAMHHRVSLDLLRYGVHLLVEKPIALSVSQADEMIKLAKRNGAVLQVGHIERFNPAMQVAGPFVRDPKFVEATRASGYTFRSTDVGVVLDLMIHDLDLVMSLAGNTVTRIDALGLAVFGPHEDVAHARLEFASGCVANLNASRVSHVARRTMQVWSSRAFSTLDFAQRTCSVVKPSQAVMERSVDFSTLSPAEKAAQKDRVMGEHLPLEQLTGEATNALSDELRDLIDSVRLSRAPRVTGEQGRDVLSVAEQILAKINTHRWSHRDAGPMATPEPSILRGPHWGHAPVTGPVHREAS